MTKSSKDKKVGYKQPPEDTQFKPGKSGNPKGRPKGSRSLDAQILHELEMDTQVRTEDGFKTYKRRDLLAKQIVHGAATGVRRHLDNVIRLDNAWQQKKAEAEKAKESVPADRWLDAEVPLRLPLHIYENYVEAVQAMTIIQREMYGDKVKFSSPGFPASICYRLNVAFNEGLIAYEESEESKQLGAWRFPYEAFEKANAKIDRQKIKEALRAQKARPPGTLPEPKPIPVANENTRMFAYPVGKHVVTFPFPMNSSAKKDVPQADSPTIENNDPPEA